MTHPKPIIRTHDPDTGRSNPTAHPMSPSPRYLERMAKLLAIIDKAYNDYWLRGKTPGLYEAKFLFSDLMTAYSHVVQAGREISRSARGPVAPDPRPSPNLEPGAPDPSHVLDTADDDE